MKMANAHFTTAALGALILAACSAAPPDEGVGNSEARASAAHRISIMKKSQPNQAAITTAGAANLQYYGGKVIPNVKVYAVNWGPNVSAVVKNNMTGFYTAVTNSAYFDWLTEYNTVGKLGVDGQAGSNQTIGRGTFGGSFTITPSTTGSVTDAQIQSELAAQLNAGKLPAPDANSLYMFDFPPGVSISNNGSGSCVQFCAYHGTMTYQGKSVPYGVHPDMSTGSGCETGCGSAPNPLDNYTSVHSHELIEAVTDMEVGIGTTVGRPLAWYDSAQGEIGDICNAQQGSVAGYVVQKQWSNKAGACIATGTTQAGNDFTIADSPASETLAPGGSATVQVKTAVSAGTAESVALTIAGLPAGVTGSFSPTSVTAGNASTLTLTASASSAGATGTFTITGKSTSATHTASNTVTVSGGTGGTCAHPICSTGTKLTASCDPCATKICAADSFCCNNTWDSICVGEVSSICGQTCP